jgi:hypothetical protein
MLSPKHLVKILALFTETMYAQKGRLIIVSLRNSPFTYLAENWYKIQIAQNSDQNIDP